MQHAKTLVVVAVVTSALCVAVGHAQDTKSTRAAQWKKVDDAIKKGLPKTAQKELEPIIKGAIADKAWAEAIKAIGKKIAYEGNVQGNLPEEKIQRLQAEIAKAPKEMVPAMDAILANWYWHYFQRNRWRFMQRTATAAPPGDDFKTWDLSRLFAEIDKRFTKALSAHAELKKIPVATYDDLLQKGTMPDAYRPTLYDVLAHNALQFYSSGEQAASKAEDAFELSADSPIFSAVKDFQNWKPQTTDDSSPTLKAIQLYQQLLAFHAGDDDQSAFIDADLLRLTFGNNKAFGEEKSARYKAALKRFATVHAKHQISARALFLHATVLQGEHKHVEAHELASRGQASFPASPGGQQCYNLIQQIEAKSSSVSVEWVWNEPLPEISVRYRNLKEVHFRIVSQDPMALIKRRSYRPFILDQNGNKALLTRPVVKKWSVDLPATDDYSEREEKIAVTEGLAPGLYYLISSHNAQFSASSNQVKYTPFWVSNLALVLRTRYGNGGIDGFVLNAITGEPISGATVRSFARQRNTRTVGPVAKTDKNGLFKLATGNRVSVLLLVEHGKDRVSSMQDYYSYQYNNQPKPSERTIFFTDRALYRPGQTIHYKGICINVNQLTDNYTVIAGRTVTVAFLDRNGKEIAKQQVRTNDYGSIRGSFTAPRDRLMGRMRLVVRGGPNGQGGFSVEEYKRPKFEVKIAPPKISPKLLAKVSVTGKATAYTGAAIGGAKVKYRVVRNVRYPYWWGRYYWWRPRAQSQEIAHGSATTAGDGSFTIDFVAKPDASVLEKDEPTFSYQINADVTDTSGETRSGTASINIGYTALSATLSAGSWLTTDKPVELSIGTTTLNGQPESAKGNVKIYRLKEPAKIQRAQLGSGYRPPMWRRGRIVAPAPDPGNVSSWELGEVVLDKPFTTDATGSAKLQAKLAVGVYRAILETRDRFGKKVTARTPLQVINPNANKLGIKLPNLVAGERWLLEPGQNLNAIWGSGYDKAKAFIEIEHRQKMLQAYWTKPGVTQVKISQAVTEAMRGGFTVRVSMVRENRAYLTSNRVTVPWTNKNLTVKWEHFVSKLEPGDKETWTATITGPDAKKAVAEMVATLYDESLDQYLPHNWMSSFNVFRQDSSNLSSQFQNFISSLNHVHGQWPRSYKQVVISYRSFPADVMANLWGYSSFSRNRRAMRGDSPAAPQAAKRMQMAEGQAAADGRDADAVRKEFKKSDGESSAKSGPDLSKVSARTNLAETAFFFPQLISTDDGEVKLEFTMPEALTRWKFLGFVHDKQLRGGLLTDSVVTAKELMIEPNPPRFVREGDELEFTVKVTNQSASGQTGSVRLTFADARTTNSRDSALGNTKTDLSFDVASKSSKSYSWRIKVPDGMEFLTYKAVGSTGRLSDGEQGYLPVLSRRILVTESLPLPIRGAQTKKFDFARLQDSKASKTIKHQSVTVQIVSNPSWYAVMALPYLMEFPHQCTEQTFNRLYANSLARHIANSDPKIRRIFDQWKGTPALDSPLEKNQDLKAVMLEETPWYRQAKKESQARRNVGILFDANRLNEETRALLKKISEMQYADGAWPWFPGGRANDYITLYITTGFGRMRHLGVDIDTAPAVKSLTRLDGWIKKRYDYIVAHKLQKGNNLSTTIALYLYGRSFFLKDKAIAPAHKQAVDYFLEQARKFWLQLANRQSQGHLALALKRFGDEATPRGIMASIKERSVSDEELGMFWRETERSWWWYRAPIETQAVMIEAFDEVMNDKVAVEDCKVWLLKQKQTQDWKTTKATADAVYALLLRGTNLLASDELVQVELGGETIDPMKVEAGTGFYEQRFIRGEVKPSLGEIKVKKVDPGVAWGSVHWQYLEDISKVTAYDGTPLKLTKQLYTKTFTKKGPVLIRVAGPVAVGDELVVRIVLRTDRDMEYVHMKDHRGSGTEPVNVLSKYRYQDGLGYYQSTRDTASHFYIDYLPKGIYVFEYSTRVVHRGSYQTGMTHIQCMYAPEFNSHSESLGIVVK